MVIPKNLRKRQMYKFHFHCKQSTGNWHQWAKSGAHVASIHRKTRLWNPSPIKYHLLRTAVKTDLYAPTQHSLDPVGYKLHTQSSPKNKITTQAKWEMLTNLKAQFELLHSTCVSATSVISSSYKNIEAHLRRHLQYKSLDTDLLKHWYQKRSGSHTHTKPTGRKGHFGYGSSFPFRQHPQAISAFFSWGNHHAEPCSCACQSKWPVWWELGQWSPIPAKWRHKRC